MILKKYVARHQGYLWIAPSFFLVVGTTIFPLFFAFSFSLYETSFFERVKFVGFQNYIQLFSESRFWTDVLNSVYFTFGSVIIALLFGIGLALMIRESSRINSVYRTIILIPWVTNEVVLALMWKWLLNPQMSILYYWTKELGLNVPNLLASENTVLATMTIINAWRSLGFTMIMIQAALSAIPKELEEACLVDGAGYAKKVFHVILPLIKPVILVVTIVITISFFNIVSLVLTMTGGGPGFSTEVMSIRLYKEAFRFFNIGYAGVLTMVILVLNIFFVYNYKKLISNESYY